MARTERSAGYAIIVYDERIVEENALDSFGRDGDAEARRRAQKVGLVNADGAITMKGWVLLNDDIDKLERNSRRWLRQNFLSVSDEGHDEHGDLVGTVRFDTDKQHELIELGQEERIDMLDASYGDLARTVWTGVSEFGANVLGGAIQFYEDEED